MATRGDSGSTTRAKRIRAAHRGAVTRLVKEIGEASRTANVGRLKQIRISIATKKNLLSGMDADMLLAVGEEELAPEINEADKVQEKAELAIIEIDDIIASLDKNSLKDTAQSSNASPIPSERTEDDPLISQATNGDELDSLLPSLPLGIPDISNPVFKTSDCRPTLFKTTVLQTNPKMSTTTNTCPSEAFTFGIGGEPPFNCTSSPTNVTNVHTSHMLSTNFDICNPVTCNAGDDYTPLDGRSISLCMPYYPPTINTSCKPPPLIPFNDPCVSVNQTLPDFDVRTTKFADIPITQHSPLFDYRYPQFVNGPVTIPTGELPYSIGEHVNDLRYDTRTSKISMLPTVSTIDTSVLTDMNSRRLSSQGYPPCTYATATGKAIHTPTKTDLGYTLSSRVSTGEPSVRTPRLPVHAAHHHSCVPISSMPPGPMYGGKHIVTDAKRCSESFSIPTYPQSSAPDARVFHTIPRVHADLATTVTSNHFPRPYTISDPVSACTHTIEPPPVPSITTYQPILHPPIHTATPHVKLPKLSMKKFNGDLTKWTTFWDSFSSSIDANRALSGIDKFNYLLSLLESSAAEAITGLTPTEANYDEAVAILKRRFGNPQLIINRHMEALLNVTGVSSQHDIKGLRRLYDAVESHIRGLKALNVPAQTYGGLLTSVLVNKLPPELRLIVTRQLTGDTWDLECLMKVIEQEVYARERAFIPTTRQGNHHRSRLPTASTLFTGNQVSNSTRVTCVYCGKEHLSSSCNVVSTAAARKEILRKCGRCYVCLRRHHVSKDCRSTYNCKKCRGRHNVSICTRSQGNSEQPSTLPSSDEGQPRNISRATPVTTNLVDSQVPVLLQTARLRLINRCQESSDLLTRAVFDSGSQRTYLTSDTRRKLRLPTVSREMIQISTFGNSDATSQMCDIVSFGVKTRNEEVLELTALVVPFICSPLPSQTILAASESHEHLIGLELADPVDGSNNLEVNLLIGSDWYWSLVTGEVIRGRSGPVAIHTKVGWMLSGPASSRTPVNLVLSSPVHTLRVDTYPIEASLDNQLKRFWELESLGIPENETSVHEKFLQQIHFDGIRYEVSLPWKENHPTLLDNYQLCCKRLEILLKKLRQAPHLLQEYDGIIRDQLERGIVERVCPSDTVSDKIHYLPHHGVVRQDKTTSKLRIVYDASAKSTGPSLNDCLYAGPKFGQSIFDILGRFRLQRIALIGDIYRKGFPNGFDS